ncbi:N-acetylglucosamine repressor [Pseudovibrio axinellae]|uniref:N-acetylglucosamine repressor n=1 Tax=Pseudovibrio axinellae TaxID=989403 RepID=A0A165Y301_9HYPH|nr:ROK family transcriptional regulator [Pseudovibrio axinellae]KZL18386.1 N-acetylglucosamine repressor [Pseudovibrio axinellae]SER70740.1 Sugar kinase of the NBD/HSP70 family, may contain an N-terminal HTH domain [Pseudovibrio axinellae]
MPLSLSETQRQIIDLLRRDNSLSRVDLSDRIGITPASISVQIRTMLGTGLLQEGQKKRIGTRGQPAVSLELIGDAAYAAGLSMSPDHITMIIMDLAGKVRGEYRQENTFSSVQEASSFASQKLLNLMAEQNLPRERLTGIGLALSGNFYADKQGLILSSSMRAWHADELVEQLNQALSVPVVVENDATAAATFENMLGNPSGYEGFFYAYIGKGIGGASVMQGQVYRGHNGNAGNLGVLTRWGKSRPSSQDLLEYLKQHGEDASSSSKLIAIYKAKPKLFDPWLQKASLQLTDMLFLATAFYDPQGIILGGTMPPEILQALVERVDFEKLDQMDRATLTQPPVSVSQYSGSYASARGAAALALR